VINAKSAANILTSESDEDPLDAAAFAFFLVAALATAS